MHVAILSCYPLCRDALANLARAELGAGRIDLFPTLEAFEADAAATEYRVGLILMDVPAGADVADWLARVSAHSHGATTVLLTDAPSLNLAGAARRLGFRGLIAKSTEQPIMSAALRLMIAGGEYFPCFDQAEGQAEAPSQASTGVLSKRQAEILVEMEAGCTNKEIARQLNISIATVKMHVRAILGVAGARNRTEAVSRLRKAAAL